MEKNRKSVRLGATLLLTAALAGNITLSTMPNAYAEGIKRGKIFEEDKVIYGLQCDGYVVKQGDTLSSISRTITRHYRDEEGNKDIKVTEKYWPMLAKLNQEILPINPGEVVYFPDTFSDADSLLEFLKDSGWTADYIKANDIYGYQRQRKLAKRKPVNSADVYALLTEAYAKGGYVDSVLGEHADCVDPDFVAKYMSLLKLDEKYVIVDDPTVERPDTFVFDFTVHLPWVHEIESGVFDEDLEQRKGK